MIAREHGAKAVLFVDGPSSPTAGRLAALSSDSSTSTAGIAAASIDLALAEKIFAAAGKDLTAIQSQLDKEDPHADGAFAIPGVTVRVQTGVERQRKPDHNVIGILHPADAGDATEYVLIGGHYDHLGIGEVGSLSHGGEEHAIHYGADDNASGTAVVLQIARTLAGQWGDANPSRGVIVAFWSGEEIGLIGSSAYAEHPTLPLERVVAYVNFDMVGRLRDNKLSLQGVGSSTGWRKLIEKRNVAAGFGAVLQDDPYLPTDATSFYTRGIPVLSVFTGAHEDYHRPTDTPDKLNYNGMKRIASFASAIVRDLASSADRLDYVKVERTDRGGSRERLRVYIGSIPDYATEVAGVKLAGTRGGSPADKAGLQSGDVIVKFAGQKISSIYDYTYAIDAAAVGTPIEVVVVRDGTEVTVTLTPEARK